METMTTHEFYMFVKAFKGLIYVGSKLTSNLGHTFYCKISKKDLLDHINLIAATNCLTGHTWQVRIGDGNLYFA